jgi:hypothetical protein
VNVIATSLIVPDEAVTTTWVSTGTVAPCSTLTVSCTGAAAVGVGEADVAVAAAEPEFCRFDVDGGGVVPHPASASAEEAPTKPTT